MKLLAFFMLCVPSLLAASTTVLVDAVPSGAMFMGASPFGLPFKDAESEDPKAIASGMSSAVSQILRAADQQEYSYICILSAAGDNPVEVFLPPAKATVKLRRKQTSVIVLFYKGGEAPKRPVEFSFGQIDSTKPHVSTKFEKIAVPPGVTTAGWIYYNLPRIQAEAIKGGFGIAFLGAGGTGKTTPVIIPGLKEPLLVHEDHATLTASWYIDAATEANLRSQAKR